MTFFIRCETLDDLKKEYRRLALIHHPDRGGDVETMKALNAEYTARHDELLASYNAAHTEDFQKHETPEEYIEIINILINIEGLDVELCGSWLWIGGETKAHKEELKAAGCGWASKKQLWYWHPKEAVPRHYNGRTTMNEIRRKYGSTKIEGEKEKDKKGSSIPA